MQQLIILALVGFIAQLIDGALGMGYGVTSASLLMMSGIAPAVASASVHAAEVVTTVASAASHVRLHNVERRLALTLAIPGAIGGFLGATLLASLPSALAKPWVAAFLFLLGASILVRFAFPTSRVAHLRAKPASRRFLSVLGLIAGFFDATGGGGWGPIATTTLLAKNESEPRQVVGSVDTSETVVAIAATVGFVLTMGWDVINLTWLLALMAGGVLAAPIAAWLVSKLPAHLLGIFVSGLILLTNARTLVTAIGATQAATLGTYFCIAIVWFWALGLVIGRHSTQQTQGV